MKIIGINSLYCDEEYVRYENDYKDYQIIIGPEGITRLKIEDGFTVGGGRESLFEYNKLYLKINFDKESGFRSVTSLFFFKRDIGALLVSESIPIGMPLGRGNQRVFSLEGIEQVLKSRDAMVVFNTRGTLRYARSSKDDFEIGKLVPSEEELVDMDYRQQIMDYEISTLTGKKLAMPKRRSIKELGYMFWASPPDRFGFGDFCVYVRNKKITLCGLGLKFLSLKEGNSDKVYYSYTEIPISIKIPTIDDVLNYLNEHEIKMLEDYEPASNHLDVEPEIAFGEGRGSFTIRPNDQNKQV